MNKKNHLKSTKITEIIWHFRTACRYFTFKIAKKYNLKGYVKNLSNGKVEVLFQGEKDALEKALNELWIGPVKGLVKNIDLKEQESIKIYQDFFIY
ncbi:MAG: acylphosphatase [Armatimonadetes bacterium]|nr:acylphosphatase [Armatimonadota bacterium]